MARTICSSATAGASASKKKLEESMKSFIANCHVKQSVDPESTFDSSEDEESKGNYIVNPDNLNQMLECSAVCKVCHSSLCIVDKIGSKHRLGTKWNFQCKSKLCLSRMLTQWFPISRKYDKIYDINRASVTGFRAIGKGRSVLTLLF